MKVALLGTRGIPPRYGGTETYVDYLSTYLAAQGDSVIVYGQSIARDEQTDKDLAKYSANIQRVEIVSISSKHLDNLIRSLLSVLHVCFDSDVDIVQINNPGPCLFAFIPRLAGKKVVCAMRALDHKRDKWDAFTSALLRLGERFAVSFGNITTVNSLAMTQYFKERYHALTVYIPNGVAPQQSFLPPRLITKWGLIEKKYILFMARLEPEKGGHTLIKAFKQLADKANGMKLVIAGHQGHSHGYYEKLQECGDGQVKFVGFTSGEIKDELFSNAYAFVLPSSVEGMSNSLLSAMAYGLPTIVSDIPENSRVIDFAPFDERLNDRPGLIFKLWDVDDLTAKLLDLISDPDRAKLRGKLLQQHVERHFKLEAMGEKTRNEYLKLLVT